MSKTTSNTTVSNEEDEVVVDGEHEHATSTTTNTASSTTAERTGVFYTGGSDSLILRWKDVSQAEAENRLRLVEEEMLVEQQLQNDLYHKRYGKVCISCYLYVHVLCTLHRIAYYYVCSICMPISHYTVYAASLLC